MNQRRASADTSTGFLVGDGEMSRRTREFDWSSTPVGPIDDWPQGLKTAVRIMLGSRYAMWLGWGPELTFFYNDAYAKMTLGPKHPGALGRPAGAVWSEIWNEVGPRAESVLRSGEATWDEGLLLFLERRGFPEESYHTFSYSPLPGDGDEVGGMLCVVTEDTERVIGERRLQTLRELAARTIDQAKSVGEACHKASEILADNSEDLPFSLIYLLGTDGRHAQLAGSSGVTANMQISSATVPLNQGDGSWPLHDVVEQGNAIVVDDLAHRFGELKVGPWPEVPQQAMVLPLATPGNSQLAGFLVVGVSSRLPFDDSYRGFFDLLAGQIAATVANARAYEVERERADALAELDRAKTAFFSNVSHEFRTPLTLMLGPIEDMLSRSYTELSPSAKGQLEVVNRNGLRLLRLVNSLLDFSRIEAGRVHAAFEPTNLAAFTRELASVFRSAIERAGLKLVVHCPDIREPVYVDREMWEKIVLNLLSNAFKFTLEGEIVITQRQTGEVVELCVRDTGTGIPSEQMPQLFERFHRIENSQGRTHEGSGIGLALVQELVKLHGGTIAAESSFGEGTTFTIRVPLGKSHLPTDQIGGRSTAVSSATGPTPYVEEALRWLPDETLTEHDTLEKVSLQELQVPSAVAAVPATDDDRPMVLVADDNSDMRQYVVRLLSERFRVTAVADGESALTEVRRRRPDLVLTDIMMPRLDGFGLLKELRDDPRTSDMPVIMLSARAGEESRVEGVEAGADDYLVKPFSARELIARVGAHLQMARMRRESAENLRQSEVQLQKERDLLSVTLASIGDAVVTTDTDSCVTNMNPVAETLTGWTCEEALGQPLDRIFRIVNEQSRKPVENPAERALREGVVVGLANHTVLIRKDGQECPIDDSAAPIRGEDGTIEGGVLVFRDITERRESEKALRESESYFRTMANNAPTMLWVTEADGSCSFLSRGWYEYTGQTEEEGLGGSGFGWLEAVHPDDRDESGRIFREANEKHEFFSLDYRVRQPDGSYRWAIDSGRPRFNEGGEFLGFIGSVIDVHERKTAQEFRQKQARILEMVASEQPLDEILNELTSFIEWQIPGSSGSILLLDKKGNRLRHGAAPRPGL
ncbi:PAS domain S-box protein [Roseimaritima ulvae]|uniref:histidine kinase n=1 Tax=Roseimaritima ulvae TaxID=980254 RepID=A0A5B9QP70_9BACT|nr:PAS domain S-box protein [Roseimaritima ulvae]QEG38816.1 Sensor histidine kinase TmoS [Roseimaritima ulvae]